MKAPSGFRIVMGVVLVVALIAAAAAIGWMAYNAGLAQGAAQSSGASLGAAQGVVPYAMYGPHFMAPFGFGFLGCLVPLVFLCLVFSLFRLVAWGGMRRHMHNGCDPRGGPMHDRMRERWHQHMDEWHREAHAAGSGEPSAKNPAA
jgi:hypothetical protein